MKALLKIFIVLGSIFTLTFIIIKFSGILSVEEIQSWLSSVKALSPWYMGLIISLLLFADLFIAVPTLTIILLSGYFLGFEKGALFSLLGIYSAGITGYILSYHYGDKFLNIIIKDQQEKEEAMDIFNKHAFIMILLSRVMPMFPEITACLSGMTKLKFYKFIVAWSLSSIPYVLIISYAGSVSTLEDPKVAIFTAVGISLFFWLSWFFYVRKLK